MATRDRSKMTPGQKAWDTANRNNYAPWPRGLTATQREARQLHSLYSHVQATYCNPQAAANYEALTGRPDVRSLAAILTTMLEKLKGIL